MKLHVLALALAATAIAPFAASAQTTVIEERSPALVIEHERPATSTTTIERRAPAVRTEKQTTIETTGSGVDCTRKTVRRDTPVGSKTVTRQECD